MKLGSYVIFCFLIAITAKAQSFKECDVYQFQDQDSLKKHIALTRKFNNYSKVVFEEYNNYWEDKGNGTGDVKSFYFYKDTLLVRRMSISSDAPFGGDSSKALCFYNDKNQLVKEDHYDFKKRLKKETPSNKDVVDESDFEKNGTWEQTSEINYTYDNKGRKKEYYAPKMHWGIQNRYTWKYDDKGRVIEYVSYHDSSTLYMENYVYTNSGYETTLIWSNSEYGSHKKVYKTDSKGREIEEQYIDKDGVMIERKFTTYNSEGLISRTVVYDRYGKMDMTHIYVYK